MEKRLVRNVQDKKIAGVCAGIGDYFNSLFFNFDFKLVA